MDGYATLVALRTNGMNWNGNGNVFLTATVDDPPLPLGGLYPVGLSKCCELEEGGLEDQSSSLEVGGTTLDSSKLVLSELLILSPLPACSSIEGSRQIVETCMGSAFSMKLKEHPL